MDLRDPNRLCNRKPLTSAERLLGVPSHAPPLENPTSSSSSSADEFVEDDVVFYNDGYTEPSPSYNHASSSSFSPVTNHHHHHNHKGFRFGSPDAFGILAALPESDASPNSRSGSHFFRKASASASVSASVSLSSSASSSSSRLIPAIPRPPSSSSVKFYQSAPVNVPISSPAMLKAARRRCDVDIDDGDEAAEEDEEMLPPHEIVARNSAQSPMLAYSVLEGVGRTLKGRDLRQVRNAVWRQTGFLG